MYQVKKRDGKIADFNLQKIAAAITKAFEAQEIETHPDIIDMLSLKVTADFASKIRDGFIRVEDIQDSVESVLIQAGYGEVAKGYILYRKQREKIRNMKSTVLVGSMINAREAARRSIEIADDHIDVVMAGVKGEFAIEDFLASGEILYWISQELDDCELSEYAKSAILASRDYDSLKEAFTNSRSARRLIELGYESDVELCSMKNISTNVAIYENQELILL